MESNIIIIALAIGLGIMTIICICQAVFICILKKENERITNYSKDALNLAMGINEASMKINEECKTMIELAQAIDKDNKIVLDYNRRILDRYGLDK